MNLTQSLFVALVLSGAVSQAHAQTEVWAHDSTPLNPSVVSYTTAIDAAGDVFVATRATRGGSDYYIALEKLDPDTGALLWYAEYDSPDGEEIITQPMVVAADGSVFFGATIDPTVVSAVHFARVRRVSGTDGSLLGTWDYQDASLQFTRMIALERDALGRVIALFSTHVENSTNSWITTRAMSSDGATIWQSRLLASMARRIAIGLTGDVFIGASLTGLVVRYDGQGAQKWSKAQCPSGSTSCGNVGLEVDSAGNPMTVSAGNNGATLVRKLKRSSGQSQWTTSFAAASATNAKLVGTDLLVAFQTTLKRLAASSGAMIWSTAATARSLTPNASGNIAGVTLSTLTTFSYATGALLSTFTPSTTNLNRIVFDAVSRRGFITGTGPTGLRTVAFD